ncbi:hypothetical protein CEXT_354941 [Caerostris extrusa]|uniref:Uncharacterized protein n=1 Tax=Caerostris extrusa TaxID=172846 RepID=A0AAV4UR17_CAEEX|nr:hypothetical protein CEXT_354941 [Caerostris extrusa]
MLAIVKVGKVKKKKKITSAEGLAGEKIRFTFDHRSDGEREGGFSHGNEKRKRYLGEDRPQWNTFEQPVPTSERRRERMKGRLLCTSGIQWIPPTFLTLAAGEKITQTALHVHCLLT